MYFRLIAQTHNLCRPGRWRNEAPGYEAGDRSFELQNWRAVRDMRDMKNNK